MKEKSFQTAFLARCNEPTNLRLQPQSSRQCLPPQREPTMALESIRGWSRTTYSSPLTAAKSPIRILGRRSGLPSTIKNSQLMKWIFFKKCIVLTNILQSYYVPIKNAHAHNLYSTLNCVCLRWLWGVSAENPDHKIRPIVEIRRRHSGQRHNIWHEANAHFTDAIQQQPAHAGKFWM